MPPFNFIDHNKGSMRQYRMIQYISYQLIVICTIIIYLYSLTGLWAMVTLMSIGGLIALLNLGLLVRTNNQRFCGHILTSTTLVVVVIANYLVRGGGMGTSYSIWFYVVPLLAASLISGFSLLIYSMLSLLMIMVFSTISIQPYYKIPEHELQIITWVNHIFAFLTIVIMLYSLKRENTLYEEALHKKNYLLKMEKNKYHDLAHFDKLTNLPNRQFFEFHLQETIDTLRVNDSATVFFMDLDNFKYINDHFGHEAGDNLLVQTAKRLQNSFRRNDFIARFGGDEFTAIVLHNKGQNIAEQIAQRIIAEFNEEFKFREIKYYSAISLGLATYPENGQTVASLMVSADQAMYAAKKSVGSFYQKA